MLKWAAVEPPLHSNEWVQLLLMFLLLLPLHVHAGAHASVLRKVKSGAWCDKLIHVNICEKTFYLHLHGGK